MVLGSSPESAVPESAVDEAGAEDSSDLGKPTPAASGKGSRPDSLGWVAIPLRLASREAECEAVAPGLAPGGTGCEAEPQLQAVSNTPAAKAAVTCARKRRP